MPKHKSLLSIFVAFAALTLVAGVGPQAQAGPVTQPVANCQTFPETGKTVCGKFLDYWKTHGGLMQQGYPISGQFQEKSEINGQTYTVQYFERAVFELHPENQPPNDVLLSLLGTIALKIRYPNGAPASPLAHAPGAGLFFPQTNQSISGVFLDYWKTHGGLAQQGYPITDTFPEKSDLNGQMYTVQYFERAVFELHPENKPPFNVLLSQLGRWEFNRKYPNGEPGGVPGVTNLQVGVWGGDHASMLVSATSAHIEFDCAHADITGAIAVDADGRFQVNGIYTFEHGGPSQPTEADSHPAVFTGQVSNGTLKLSINITDKSQTVGPFALTFGQQGRIVKCL